MKSGSCFLLLGLITLLLLSSCGSTEPAATTIPATEPPIAADMLVPTDTPLPTEPPSPPTGSPDLQPEDRTWPTKRESFAMAYDAESDQVLIFCGYDEFVSGLAWQHEMDLKARDEWAYDVAQNRLELLRVQPYTIYNQAVYDQQSRRLIGFGPENTAVYNPENGVWEKTEPAEEPPPYRFWYDLAYDSQSDRVVLFGGECYTEMDDTWAYDYDSNTWTEMTPEVSPEGRWAHAMAYDAESDRIIMWGAHERNVDLMSDEEHETIWAYDYESNTWTAVASSGGPSYRHGHTMVYHPGTDKMVLFGGIAGTWLKEEINDELWIFDPVAEEWSQVLPGSTNP